MKSRFEALAYGMLGSVADAEDVVQEATLRLHQLKTAPASEEAFLYRVVSNLAIDRLRRAKTERENYYGPWLPEPVQEDASAQVELAQALTIGFVHLLEALPPAERIVYVLRESFDLSYNELASVLEISAQTARQRMSRARKRMALRRKAQAFPNVQDRQLLERLVELVARGDMEGLVGMLAEDAVAYTDGGGVVSAAVRPIYGAHRIATVFVHLAGKAAKDGPLSMNIERLSGTWALVIKQAGQLNSIHFVAGEQGKIHRLYAIRNPAKMSHLSL